MIEAMKQALEALEKIDGAMPFPVGRSAITSLRQAIAELESQEPVAWQERKAKRMKDGVVAEWSSWYPCLYRTIDEARTLVPDHIPYEWRPLYTHPPQRTEQEGKQMIDWYSVEGETRSYGVGMVECAYAIGRDEIVHVVTHESVKDIAMQHLPIQRTWVGLTDEEVNNAIKEKNIAPLFTYRMIARTIESKLKQKNGFTEEKNT